MIELDRVGFDREQMSPVVALVLMNALSRIQAVDAGLGAASVNHCRDDFDHGPWLS